uniref:Uncharacterized protein n=1 Tax=Anguilla anguilla TaxID=7936 RepID=A0A0E9VP78_ANGAN
MFSGSIKAHVLAS